MVNKAIKGDITRLRNAEDKVRMALFKISDAYEIINSCNVVKASEFEKTVELIHKCSEAIIEIQAEATSLTSIL